MIHMAEEEQRHRIVFLGAGRVGKSSILHRFLTGGFSLEYKMTVEDLHPKEYVVEGNQICVDFLDTAGDLHFPAMRRLCISNAHAFVLVYALDQKSSFDAVRLTWEEIKEQRSDYREIPRVIVSNKMDICGRDVEVDLADVYAWADREGLRNALVKTSALEDTGIVMIFQKLLEQTKYKRVVELEAALSRRLSAKEGRTHRKTQDKLKESEGKLNRSRSLIKRATRPKVKHTGGTDSDCVLS